MSVKNFGRIVPLATVRSLAAWLLRLLTIVVVAVVRLVSCLQCSRLGREGEGAIQAEDIVLRGKRKKECTSQQRRRGETEREHSQTACSTASREHGHRVDSQQSTSDDR